MQIDNKKISNKRTILIGVVFCFFFVCACNHNGNKQKGFSGNQVLIPDSTIKYAQLFLISKGSGFKVVHLLGKANSPDTTANFIIYDSIKPKVFLNNAHFIKSPAKRIISLSSIYSSMLTELGCGKNIVAIENADYYNNPIIINEVNNGKIAQVQKNPEIDKEAVIKLTPDIIFAFGMGKSSGDFDSKLTQNGIPVLMSLDHLEKLPLARAEWIKVFAAFVNKSSMADSLFAQTEKSYLELKKIASSYTNQPTVLTELKYGDTWYVPGGRSFMARLINDAHANYIWRDDTLSGSLTLSFEEVYKKAKNADFWLNVSMCNNKKQIVAQDYRYADFLAYKKSKIYNNNLNSNSLNYSTYWETGIMYPNRILSDLISIFHAANNDSAVIKMNYYKRIE